MPKGKFIVVEGLEGAGKSTVLSYALNYLTQSNLKVVVVREPGGTEISENIRTILKADYSEAMDAKTELLLMYASRAQLLSQIIRPALARGEWVIADRFEWSTIAYQGYGRKLPLENIHQLSRMCVAKTQPDHIIFMDIDPAMGLARAEARGQKDRIEKETLGFFQRVQEGYYTLANNCDYCTRIDAEASLEKVKKCVLQTLYQLL